MEKNEEKKRIVIQMDEQHKRLITVTPIAQ